MHHQHADMQACIGECLRCYRNCLDMASHHCHEAGGQHVAAVQMPLMLACAEIWRASAAILLIGIEQRGKVCAVCAEICEACARTCEAIGGMDA
jgi:hypothetical protein